MKDVTQCTHTRHHKEKAMTKEILTYLIGELQQMMSGNIEEKKERKKYHLQLYCTLCTFIKVRKGVLIHSKSARREIRRGGGKPREKIVTVRCHQCKV